MPLFQYLCLDCEAASELLVRGSETPQCPECESRRLEKQMSHVTPMKGGSAAEAAPAPTPCGQPSCCQMQGGGCSLN